MRITVGLLVLLSFISSCDETISDPADLASDFSLNFNLTRYYSVESIQYEITGNDTLNYFSREYLLDSSIQNGTTTYLIQVDTSSSISGPWKVLEVYQIRDDGQKLIRRENGSDYVVLNFPVWEGKEWDGNAFNTQQSRFYTYRASSLTDSDFSNEDLIEVVISDVPANVVNQDERYEVYAREAGLIEKKSIIFNFCTTSDCEFGEILSGTYYYQRLVSYE